MAPALRSDVEATSNVTGLQVRAGAWSSSSTGPSTLILHHDPSAIFLYLKWAVWFLHVPSVSFVPYKEKKQIEISRKHKKSHHRYYIASTQSLEFSGEPVLWHQPLLDNHRENPSVLAKLIAFLLKKKTKQKQTKDLKISLLYLSLFLCIFFLPSQPLTAAFQSNPVLKIQRDSQLANEWSDNSPQPDNCWKNLSFIAFSSKLGFVKFWKLLVKSNRSRRVKKKKSAKTILTMLFGTRVRIKFY